MILDIQWTSYGAVHVVGKIACSDVQYKLIYRNIMILGLHHDTDMYICVSILLLHNHGNRKVV